MKLFAEFIYQDGDSITYKPVFIERDEEWEAFARFNELVNHVIDNYELLQGSAPVIVSDENEAILRERAETFSLGNV